MSDLSKYPTLERKKSGIYAVRLRVPKDLCDFVDFDAAVWDAISLHPGSLLNAWRDALTTTSKVPRGPTKTRLKREFKKSLNVRTLEDAKPAYFALRDDLARVFNIIRKTYAQELISATQDDFYRLAANYFAQIEIKAEREANQLLPYPDERLKACENIAEDIHELETGHPSLVANHQKTARSILLENGLQTDTNGHSELTGLLIRKTLHSLENSVRRYQGKFDADVSPQSARHDNTSTNPQNEHPLGITFDRYLEDKQRLKIKSLEYLEAFGRSMLDFYGTGAPTGELTRQGAREFMHKLYLFVAIDRTSKFAVAQLVDKANRKTAWEFLETVLEAVPYKIHTILTDNGIQFCEQLRNRNTHYSRPMRFDMICAANKIEHRLTKPNHPWTNGQVERMNRTIKEATVKRYHYDSHNQLRGHLSDFLDTYNYARRLKTLNWPHTIRIHLQDLDF